MNSTTKVAVMPSPRHRSLSCAAGESAAIVATLHPQLNGYWLRRFAVQVIEMFGGPRAGNPGLDLLPRVAAFTGTLQERVHR